MENSKLLIRVFILVICSLIGCVKNSETKVNIVGTIEKDTIKQELILDTFLIDSTKFIIKSIEDVFTNRKLKYTIIEKSYSDSIYEYKFIVSSLNKAEFYLVKKWFDSEREAMVEIQRIKKLKKEEPLIKIVNFSFRKNNIIYSINSTENISHIRSVIFNDILKYFNVNQSDIVLY